MRDKFNSFKQKDDFVVKCMGECWECDSFGWHLTLSAVYLQITTCNDYLNIDVQLAVMKRYSREDRFVLCFKIEGDEELNVFHFHNWMCLAS